MAKESIMKWRPAKYHPGKECHVAYWCYNPNTLKLQRIRIKVNHIEEKHRTKYAEAMCDELNQKLFNGWNPLLKQITNAGVKFNEAIKSYIRVKNRELREDSMRSYRSIIKYFEAWITRNNLVITPQQFEKGFANKIMGEIAETSSIRTYNSYLGMYKALFNWLVENEYCKVNPFDHLSKKKAQEKSRQMIDQTTRKALWDWMAENHPNMQMISALVYYCFIRPKEITFLKPGNFDFTGQTIYIPPEASKNKMGQRVTIPDNALEFFRTWITQREIPAHYYLFSKSKTLNPGNRQTNPRNFAKAWDKMRTVLEMPAEYQLYSLKDTGIVQMLEEGVPPNEVMIQARHSDLKVTTEYLKHTSRGNSQYHVKTKTKSITG